MQTTTTLADLENCFECADLQLELDAKHPHLIDYINGMYFTEHRQSCWPSIITFKVPIERLSQFHESGHKVA